MPESRTAFMWTLRYEDPLMADEVLQRVRETVATWMQLYPKRYSDGWTTGSMFGLLQVGVTVTHRDQWAAQREVRKFAAALAIRAKVTMSEVRDPDGAKLAPHPFRGARRMEAAKYRIVNGVFDG